MLQGRAPELAARNCVRAAADAVRPLVVCGSACAAAATTERLRREGWLVQSGWNLPWREWDVASLRVVCLGELERAPHAHAALLAAARGAGVVAVAGAADRRLLARFFEDLSRFGPVELRAAADAAACPGADLGEDEHRVLALLAAGITLGEAARQLHISRRTADRRLAAARAALGVRTTAEAVVAFARDATAARRVA